jgi:Cd2+/Zn2+-exporting ATPase
VTSGTAHTAKSGEELLQLDIPVVLPGVDDESDGCVHRLIERLKEQTGVENAHLEHDATGKSVICLHYDPNLMVLEKLERLARSEGAEITNRFRHETLPVKGMDCASCAQSVEHVVRKTKGVLTVSVNYPTQKLKVEYDSTLTDRATIIKAVSRLGYRVPLGTPLQMVPMSSATPVSIPHVHGPNCNHDHEGHHHHHEHTQDSSNQATQSHIGHQNSDHAHSHDEDENASWLVRNRELAMALTSGLFLALGYFGELAGLISGTPAAILYAISLVAGGYNLARHAIPTLISGRFDVEFLMLAGAIGAVALNKWPEGAFLLFLFSLGHALEHYAMERARSAISALGKLTPKTALVRRGGQEIEVPTETLLVGDVAIVRAGERLPVDGTIIQGHSSIDQSPITGESVPVDREIGESVFAGSINGDGALEVEVTRLASDTTIARVMRMVEEAQAQKAPSQIFSEKFERIFVPTVLGITVLAAVVPPIFNLLTWEEALLRSISTLVASSPCALALATPAAVLAGIAQAARNGVLIKGGVHLENLGDLKAIAFDKTGTLTEGRPTVSDIIPVEGITSQQLLKIAAAVESHSNHPLAQAVVTRAKDDQLVWPASGDLQTIKGRGVYSEIDGEVIRVGNLKMFEDAGISVPDTLQKSIQDLGASGKPTMIIGQGQRVLGVIALADALRSTAKSALGELRKNGVEALVMLTGDNAKVAANIAPQAGVTDYRADLLPENKVEVLNELMRKHGKMAMVGDGVNDAPALANATVGIAMGAGGTDVALETADVALMGDDLSKLPFAVGLSRQARNIIRQNLWISLGVICILVPSTLFGFAKLGIVVIFHEGSTIIVCLNALRLLRYRQ